MAHARTNERDSDDPLVFVEETMHWKDPPKCAARKEVLTCKYNHDKGRGLIIYSRPGIRSFNTHLVCAQNAAKSGGGFLGIFATSYVINSRCVVSSLFWDAYIRHYPEVDMRSDVEGLLSWVDQPMFGEPIMIPKIIGQQCDKAFPNSIYCTPTLIINQTENEDFLNICTLRTKRNSGGFLFIRISTGNSRWDCRLVDLKKQDKEDDVLSTQEEACVPDFKSEVDPRCDLPYIPREQNKFRVKKGNY